MIRRAVADAGAGRPVVLAGASAGHVVVAAEHATPEAVNFMVRHARGIVCLALTPERCDELLLEPMPADGGAGDRAPLMVSIEARDGVTTGVSAHDRSHTVRVAIDPATRPQDLVRPGHVLPVRARRGGLLEHRGEAEAAVELMRMAGLRPGAAICAVLREDGALAIGLDLAAFAERHGLTLVDVRDLAEHRLRGATLVERVTSTRMPTRFGEFDAVGFRSLPHGPDHLAMVKGDVEGAEDVLVCLHAECLAGDVFGALGCGCPHRVGEALELIEREGRGVLLYIGREGCGIGAAGEVATALGPLEEAVGAQMLAELGPRSTRGLGDVESRWRECAAAVGSTKGERCV